MFCVDEPFSGDLSLFRVVLSALLRDWVSQVSDFRGKKGPHALLPQDTGIGDFPDYMPTSDELSVRSFQNLVVRSAAERAKQSDAWSSRLDKDCGS